MRSNPAYARLALAASRGVDARAASLRNNRNNNVSLPQAGD